MCLQRQWSLCLGIFHCNMWSLLSWRFYFLILGFFPLIWFILPPLNQIPYIQIVGGVLEWPVKLKMLAIITRNFCTTIEASGANSEEFRPKLLYFTWTNSRSRWVQLQACWLGDGGGAGNISSISAGETRGWGVWSSYTYCWERSNCFHSHPHPRTGVHGVSKGVMLGLPWASLWCA